MASPLCFGRYETLFRIASGGMAEVFAARVRGELGFEKLVAVKRIVPHLAEDSAFVHMFLDEARLAAQVSSPHVVQTLDLGRTDDGSLYIAMELVVGVTLSDLLTSDSRIPVGVAVEIAAQAAEGLHDAHEARTPDGRPLEIVHRDVSPQNVLVGVDGRVKVTDFGIARASQGRLAHTEHGQLKGKVAYFSPEQSRGAPLDRRSDVFALGVVLWEMLAGQRLFTRATPADTIVAVRRAQVPALPEVPRAIADVVRRALAREPSGRHESAGELARSLRRAAHDAELATGNAEIAGYLQGARIERLAQLRERIRAALEAPEVRTLPDIEHAPAAPVVVSGERAQAPTVVLEPSATVPDAVHASRTARGSRARRAWLAAAGVVALVGALAYGSSIAARDDAGGAATIPAEDLLERREDVRSPPTEPAPALSEPTSAPELGAVEHELEVAPSEPVGAPREPAERERGPAPSSGEQDHETDRAVRPSRRRPRPPRDPGSSTRAERDRSISAPAGLDAFERGVRR